MHLLKPSCKLVLLGLLMVVVSCNRPGEVVLRKWPAGQKKVTYTIYKGDTSDLVDVLYKAYFPNGQIFKVGKMEDGRESGLWQYYYQSGKIKSKGNYTEGRMDGDFQTFYESGEVEQKGKYAGGQLVDLALLNKDGSVKNYNEDLSGYLVATPQKWTTEQIEEIKVDCIMAMEPNYDNVDDFCNCVLDSLQRHCNYADVKQLTENQRGILLGYVTNNQKDCFNKLLKKNLR